MNHRKFYRLVFLAAGVYNIAWGLLTALYPDWLFDFAGIERMRYPFVFGCVGMIVGLYGVVYLEIARRPEQGFLLAGVGLVGKILGPIGWVWAYLQGIWPLATIITIVTNDLIWWIPFFLYLRASWPYYEADLKKGW